MAVGHLENRQNGDFFERLGGGKENTNMKVKGLEARK